LDWRGFPGYGPWGYSYQPTITKKEEKEILEDEVAGLEEELKTVNAHPAPS
jgi:hypothetical protein